MAKNNTVKARHQSAFKYRNAALPNTKTLKVFKQTDKERNFVRAENSTDLFKKLSCD